MDQFKQETMTLLREQTTQIKILRKQLSIKEEQIKFLKETIINLEEEKEEANNQSFSLKTKMKTMLQEVSTYNQTVVSRVHQDNTNLAQEIQQLKTNLQDNIATITKLTNSIKHLESINTDQTKQLVKLTNKFQQNQTQNENLKKRINSLQTINKNLTDSQLKNSIKIEQLENRISTYSQQIEVVTKKYQQNLNSSESKIKILNDNMVAKDKYRKLQENYQQSLKNIQSFKEKFQKLKKQLQIKTFNLNSSKDQYLSKQIKHQITISNIETDITNLLQSIKINKKITEFQSSFSQKFEQIYQLYKQCSQENQELRAQVEKNQQLFIQMQKKILIRQSQIQQLQMQTKLLRKTFREQSQSIQSSYQGQIIQLQLKIKKQQRALHDLSIKQRQYQQLCHQYQSLKQEHNSLNNTSQRTIHQINVQNNKLILELNQMSKICQTFLNNKGIVNTLKYVINDLLTVIYYFHLLILRNRQKNRKLFMPFIQYYYFVHEKGCKKRSPLFKLRKCVIGVVLIIRIQSGISKKRNNSILRYSELAIQTRQKIGNIGTHLDNIIQISGKQSSNIEDIVKAGKGMYRWNIHNFKRILLHPQQDLNFIQESIENNQTNLILTQF